jgi:SpoVK/Ycf46/Vps4 family AAA+-type ATPase
MEHYSFDDMSGRRFRAMLKSGSFGSLNTSDWPLARVKHAQYLLQLLHSLKLWEMNEIQSEEIAKILGYKGLSIAINAALCSIQKYRTEAFDKDKKSLSAVKSFQSMQKHVRYCMGMGDGFTYQQTEKWASYTSLVQSHDWRSDLSMESYSRFSSFKIRKTLLFAWARRLQESLVDKDEPLLARMRQLRLDLRLDEMSLEILLACHLVDNHRAIGDLHNSAISQSGYKLPDSVQITATSLAPLLGYPEIEIANRISGPGGLFDLGLLEYDGTPSVEVEAYLTGSAMASLLNHYAMKASQEALPLERFTYSNEAKLVRDLFLAHSGERPLHILLHGVEGTGKTELARSIAQASNRTLLEVGRNLEDSLPKDAQKQQDAIIRFRLRALRITESHERNEPVVLLMDEADHLLNWGEKGVLNQFMEETRLPVIWIANSIVYVERSTLRRFDYQLEFKLTQREARLQLWNSVVERYKAQDAFPQERCLELASRYETAAGGIDLAVRNELSLRQSGIHDPIAESILQSHSELLELKTNEHIRSRSPRYAWSCLNLRQNKDKVLESAKFYSSQLLNGNAKSNMTLLLYGPPGTGKTEFARHLARESGLDFAEIPYSQIASRYVGESEKNLRKIFRQASKCRNLLFIDEADSLVGDRRNAQQSWEVSLVNEFLVQLESCQTLVVCATNFQGHLDPASRRRFHFHLEFQWLDADGIRQMFQVFFPDLKDAIPDTLLNASMLAPGDFHAVYQRLRWLDASEITIGRISEELHEEIAAKNPYGNRKIGF